MAIITKTFTAYFTQVGVPATGLSPTIDIRQLDLLDPANLVVPAAAMTERGSGFYTYDFATYDTTKNYAFVADGGGALSQFERYVAGTNVCDDVAGIQEQVVDGILDEVLNDHLNPDSVGESLAIIRGLSKQNFVLDSTTFSSNGVLLMGRIRIWDEAANVGTPTGIIAEYQVEAIEGVPGTFTQHKMVRTA